MVEPTETLEVEGCGVCHECPGVNCCWLVADLGAATLRITINECPVSIVQCCFLHCSMTMSRFL